MKFARYTIAAAICGAAWNSAVADVNVGVVLSLTGPAASLGIPNQKSIQLFPKEIGGQKINYIFRDDKSDPTEAVVAAKKLIDEDKVDALIGPSITPCGLALVDVAAGAKVPDITLSAGANVVSPVDDKRKWVFGAPQTTDLMAKALVDYMARNKITKVAFIGFDNAYGEEWFKGFSEHGKAAGIQVVANERYSPKSTSVTGQVLHLLAAQPQAVLIAASGTAAALPQSDLRQKGYKGQIFQTHGVANPDFLRVCGAACDGTILPVAPGVVAPQLPNDPIWVEAKKYAAAYDAAYGAGQLSQFSTNAWDTGVLLQHALPVALKTAQPSDLVAFRAALRNALEGLKNVPGADGVYNMSPTVHNGLDQRAAVMVRIEGGKYQLLK